MIPSHFYYSICCDHHGWTSSTRSQEGFRYNLALGSLSHHVCWSNRRLRLGLCMLIFFFRIQVWLIQVWLIHIILCQSSNFSWFLMLLAPKIGWSIMVDLQCFAGYVTVDADSLPISIKLNHHSLLVKPSFRWVKPRFLLAQPPFECQ